MSLSTGESSSTCSHHVSETNELEKRNIDVGSAGNETENSSVPYDPDESGYDIFKF